MYGLTWGFIVEYLNVIGYNIFSSNNGLTTDRKKTAMDGEQTNYLIIDELELK